jgi:hypothetical protein
VARRVVALALEPRARPQDQRVEEVHVRARRGEEAAHERGADDGGGGEGDERPPADGQAELVEERLIFFDRGRGLRLRGGGVDGL